MAYAMLALKTAISRILRITVAVVFMDCEPCALLFVALPGTPKKYRLSYALNCTVSAVFVQRVYSGIKSRLFAS